MKNWKSNNKGIYLFNNDMIYVIPTEKKPVKLVIENDNTTYKPEKYKMTLKEVLWDILRWNYKLRETLTRQQIHSERGKIKRRNYIEVINFLVKRGFTREYINNEVNMERERLVVSQKWDVLANKVSTTKFGYMREF